MTTQTINPSFKDNKTIFVSGLPKTLVDAELFKLVNDIAANEVQTIHIVKKNNYDRRIGYINMKTHESAKKVIDKMNGTLIHDMKVNMFWTMKNQISQNESNLYIKGIKKTFTQQQLQEILSVYGDIMSLRLSTSSSNESNGYCYVKYVNVADAEKVLSLSNEIKNKIGDEDFMISRYEKQAKATQKTNLYIGNIDPNITEDQFVKYFETFGKIKECKSGKKLYAIFDVEHTGKKKGYVNYENYEDAENVLKSPKTNVLGEGELVIEYYKTKQEMRNELRKRDDEIRKVVFGVFKEFNLYVVSNKENISVNEIATIFQDCGEIYSAKVKYKDRMPTGIFYICMKNGEDAEKVKSKCQELGWSACDFKSREEMMPKKSNMFPMAPFAFGSPFMGQQQHMPMNYSPQAFFMNVMQLFAMNQFGNTPMYNTMIPGMQQTQPKMNQPKRNGNEKKQKMSMKGNSKMKSKVQKEVVPQQPPEIEVTEEMKNELGDNLYDYISEVHKFDEDLTGRITGVLLESLKYSVLKDKIVNDKKGLDNIIIEIKSDLDNMSH